MSKETDNSEENDRQETGADDRFLFASKTSAELVNPLWVVAVRLCITVTALLSVTVCTFFGSEETAERVRFLFTPVACLFVLNACSAFWSQYSTRNSLFYLAHILIDVQLVTGVIYITGGSTSPFIFLYLLLAMAASALVSRPAGLTTCFLSWVSHGALLFLISAGALAPADGVELSRDNTAQLLVQSLGLASSMVLVTIGTSFLRTRLLQSYELVSESQRSIIELHGNQDRILEDFPGAVITTDLDLLVKTYNRAARDLLNSRLENAAKSSISSILPLPLKSPRSFAEWVALEAASLELAIPGQRIRKAHLVCKPIYDGIGTITGLIFFLTDITQLRSAEEKLAIQERMAALLAEKQRGEPGALSLAGLIGESPIMQKVFNLIQRVAPTDTTVLISGESGTGKELVARSIHYSSPRATQPFVAVNCGAIPEHLIESELFGHKKGAFTGADSDTIGLFRQAHGGTLFLDEIGELPLLMQAKILRCIQEKSVRPVGGTTDIPVDIRIVTATNRNLKREVEENRFREDLYYRLNVIGIHLPALKERRGDIPLLIGSILKRMPIESSQLGVSPDALELLHAYDYPGNVRELENILERAAVLGGSFILPEHLPEAVRMHQHSLQSPRETIIVEDPSLNLPVDLDRILESIERKYIELALHQTDGAKKKAANLLGMNFRSFRYRLQKFGLSNDNSSPSAEQ